MNAFTPRVAWLALVFAVPLHAQTTDQQLVKSYQEGARAYDEGRWQDAQRHMGYVVDNLSADFKRNSPYEYAQLLNRCGYANLKVGDFDKAEKLLKEGLAVREVQGPREVTLKSGALTGAPAIAESKVRLGYLYVVMNRFVEARPLFEQVTQQGGDAAECEYYLGWISRALGQYDEAKQHHDAALKGRQQELASVEALLKASPEDAKLLKRRLGVFQMVAHLRNDRGLLFQALGQYGTARTELEAAEKLWVYVDPQGRSPDQANCLMNLGILCRDLGDFTSSASYFNKSRTIWDRFPNHLGRAKCLQNQGTLYATLYFKSRSGEDQTRALKCCDDCLAICDQHPASAEVALYLDNLAWMLHGMDRLADARKTYERSLALWAELLPQHPERARTLCNYGWLLHCQGGQANLAQAQKMYEAGRQLRLDTLGAGHHTIALSDANLAALYKTSGDSAKASALMTQALKSLRRYESQELAYLPDAEQLGFLLHTADAQSHASIFHLALSMARGGTKEPALVAASAEWVINGKAVSQEALAQKILQSRDLRNAEVVAKLARVRTGLARLTANPPDGKDAKTVAAHQQEFQKLKIEERAAEGELARKLAAQNADRVEPWVSLDAVRSGIPQGAVLIEIVRFRVWNFQSKQRDPWEGECYGAWIVPPRGDVRFVDLGAAGPIDAAAEALQAAMVEAEKMYNAKNLAGIKDQEANLRGGALKQLQERVLQPLRDAIDPQCKRWLVSPDANLWLVPLAALPQDGNKYLIDTHNISYVVSGRDLGRTTTSRAPRPSVVLAAPTYGQGTRSLGLLGQIVFPPLLSARAEAKAVVERLSDAGPLIQGDAATESAFRRLSSPRVLHLVTHGFALKKSDDATLPQDPLSLCGLALVGANDPQRASRAPEDDGLLMGKEVLAADLRGTELVTLSACQTGLGNVSSGESVASLRQAFHLAGAQNVVATLWSIPDTESTRLMVSFYDQMKKNPDLRRADALCQSQRDTLRLLRAQGKTSPFYWAAFTLSGKDSR